MGCGVSKFHVEEENPKSVHVRRTVRLTRIPTTQLDEDDDYEQKESRGLEERVKVVGADERPGVLLCDKNGEELMVPKKVVVFVPPPSVQVVYGGDLEEEPSGREDSISCNPGSPTFRVYCISHDSEDDQDDEEFGAKEEKISTNKGGLLKSGKRLGARATRRRRVRGLKSFLHRGSPTLANLI